MIARKFWLISRVILYITLIVCAVVSLAMSYVALNSIPINIGKLASTKIYVEKKDFVDEGKAVRMVPVCTKINGQVACLLLPDIQ